MAKLIKKTVSLKSGKRIRVLNEDYDSAQEVARFCAGRAMTSGSFHDMRAKRYGEFEGVGSYDEALSLLANGYQPTVEALKSGLKLGLTGQVKRVAFENAIAGFAPVVPLALKGVPNCMIDTRMKPIKQKVLDVYYSITANYGVASEDIIKAGQSVLGGIVALEQQGYKFNLYAMQEYANGGNADILTVKVKSSNQPIDLKRISFPLTHTAFFRVIGFDWYSKVPGGTYRVGYGHGLGYDLRAGELNEFVRALRGENAICISNAQNLKDLKRGNKEYVQNLLLGKEG